MVRKVIIVSVHVRYFSFFSFFSLCQTGYVRLRQVMLGYIRLHKVTSVYVGGTGRGARQFNCFIQKDRLELYRFPTDISISFCSIVSLQALFISCYRKAYINPGGGPRY